MTFATAVITGASHIQLGSLVTVAITVEIPKPIAVRPNLQSNAIHIEITPFQIYSIIVIPIFAAIGSPYAVVGIDHLHFTSSAASDET